MIFADPERNGKKKFALYLRKDVPRLVQRCQGNCGKRITEVCFLVVKSFGTTRSTDRNGNERSKFEPIYLHFEKKYLKSLTQKITMDLLKVLTTVV